MSETLGLRQNNIPTTSSHNPSYNKSSNAEVTTPLPAFNLAQISKELFDTIADECANKIAIANQEGKNKPTQLRRFYDELVLYYDRIEDESSFNDALPFIYMIKSKIAYAKGRGNVDIIFQTFMNNLINQIKDIQTLKNAKLFMEAVMGFYKSYAKKD